MPQVACRITELPITHNALFRNRTPRLRRLAFSTRPIQHLRPFPQGNRVKK
jgi:hypothetical protein